MADLLSLRGTARHTHVLCRVCTKLPVAKLLHGRSRCTQIQHKHTGQYTARLFRNCTSPESRDSSTRQLPLSSSKSHVAFPGNSTITSPGTSRCDDTALQQSYAIAWYSKMHLTDEFTLFKQYLIVQVVQLSQASCVSVGHSKGFGQTTSGVICHKRYALCRIGVCMLSCA